jgi:hypothetical protein
MLVVLNGYSQRKVINNSIDKNYYTIPGTKYALILPDSNFKNSSTFTGVKNELKNTAIIITELPYSYDSTINIFSKNNINSMDSIIYKTELIVNGFNVSLTKVKSSDKYYINDVKTNKVLIKWLMFYGNDSLTLVLVSGCYDSLLVEQNNIEKSLLSFIYLNELKNNPLDALDFSLSVENTPLKFVEIIFQKGAFFNTSKQPFGKSSYSDSLNLAIIQWPIPLDWEEREERQKILVSTSNNEKIELIEKKDLLINNIKAYSVAYYQQSNGKNTLNYDVTFYCDNKYYTFNATAYNEFEKNLIVFKKIANSFKLK